MQAIYHIVKFERMGMKEALIFSIAEALLEQNSFGDKSSSYENLVGYYYAAIDILSAISMTKTSIKKSV